MSILHSFVTLIPFLGLRAAQGCFHIINDNSATRSSISSFVLENEGTCSLHCTIPGVPKNDLDVSVDYGQRHIIVTGILNGPPEEKMEYLQQAWLLDSSVNLLELTMGMLDGNLTISVSKQVYEKQAKAKKAKIRGAPRNRAIETGDSADAGDNRSSVESAPFPPLPNSIAAARFTEIGAVDKDFEHWNHFI
jgi:HSP20 family molecular chaperone IbpA